MGKPKRKFIITDPLLIMGSEQYRHIVEVEQGDFEGQSMPLKSKHIKSGEDFIFRFIIGTLHGNGRKFLDGKYVQVISGMLCIAECENGWLSERFGMRARSMNEAIIKLRSIIYKF